MRRSNSLPTITNKNVTYIDKPVSWVFYVSLFLFLRIVLAGLGFNAAASWTIVNWAHGIISFFLFHWIKGSPFAEDHEECSSLTFWEQIDDQIQYTRARKFLLIFPIILFLIATDSSDWDLAFFWINLAICAVSVISKLPFMHEVRLFGINS